MKAKIFLAVLILWGGFLSAQRTLFQEANIEEVKLNKETRAEYERFRKAPNVIDFSIIYIDTKQLKTQSSLLLNHKEFSTSAIKIEEDNRGSSAFTWFGRLSDETGIFITVMGDRVFSKFYMGNIPYSITPLSDGYHMLLGFENGEKEAQCSHERDSNKHETTGQNNSPSKKDESDEGNNEGNMVDDNCNLRMLIVFTDDADATLNMQIIGQGMVDETNLAYIMSDIGFRMELARTVMVNYNQTNATANRTVYAANFDVPGDLANIQGATNGFEDIPALRDLYKADVVVLVRQGLAPTLFGLAFGTAFGIPTGTFVPDEQFAFASVHNDATLTTLVSGRFTFAHEVGHVQGGRHENHNAAPNYARGNIFAPGVQGRTILARGAGCAANTGCRVNFFSNPDVTFGGIAVGDALHDNARRLDETSDIMKNHRVTDEDLVISGETFEQEAIANHLANKTIVTSNNVNAQNGTRVTMRAGNSICLNPGFESEPGAVLTACIVSNPCSKLPVGSNPFLVKLKQPEKEEFASEQPVVLAVSPNPVVKSATITFNLNTTTGINLSVYDINGRKIKQLANGTLNKGNHEFVWKAEDLSPGVYLARLIYGDVIQTARMVLTY